MRSTLGRWLVCGAIGVAALAGPAAAQTLKEAPAVLNKQDAAAQHFQLGVEFYRAGGRLMRLHEQQNHGPQTVPTVPALPALDSPGPARGVEPTARG